MSGVNVACPKHGVDHVLKPTDAAQLVKYYMSELAIVGFQAPLPRIDDVSTPSTLARAMCPQDDLDKIKAARENGGSNSRRMPTLSKVWQETFLKPTI